MIVHVNPQILDSGLFIPLADYWDDERDENLSRYDVNCRKDVSAIVSKYIGPHYYQYDEKSKEIIDNSLLYYMSVGVDLDRLYASNHISLNVPMDSKLFLKWLWEGLHPDVAPSLNPYVDYIFKDIIPPFLLGSEI